MQIIIVRHTRLPLRGNRGGERFFFFVILFIVNGDPRVGFSVDSASADDTVHLMETTKILRGGRTTLMQVPFLRLGVSSSVCMHVCTCVRMSVRIYHSLK